MSVMEIGLLAALVLMTINAFAGWREAFREQSQKEYAQGRIEGFIKLVNDLGSDVRQLREINADLTERIATMKRDGFNSGTPVVEQEETPTIPSEIQSFINRINSPVVADELERDAEEALMRGEEPSMILERLRNGAGDPLWAS